jgi:hypothetical protein
VQDETLTNGYEAGSGMGGTDDVVFGAGLYYINGTLPAGKTEFGIDRGMMHHYQTATQAQFKAFFPVGNLPYSSNSWAADGVIVYWTGPNGEEWNTRNGPVDQTGSTFKILSVQDFVDLKGDYYVKVKVEFSCKLYNGAGASKQLTNGEAVMVFGMI